VAGGCWFLVVQIAPHDPRAGYNFAPAAEIFLVGSTVHS